MLYYFIGLPRSGKSTISRRWVRYQETGVQELSIGFPDPRVVINSDAMRKTLTGQAFFEGAEGMVSAIKYLNIRTFLAEGYDVLVDGTHTTQNSIERIRSISKEAVPIWMFPKNQIEECNVDWQAHVQTCKDRARKTEQEYLYGPIDRMARNLENLVKEMGDLL